MTAYRETVRFMDTDPAALDIYAKWLSISPELASRSRDFFAGGMINPDRIVGLNEIMATAVTTKFLARPLTQSQLSELIQIPAAQ
jgi:NitT/TauT family transport system substrate-binding protein